MGFPAGPTISKFASSGHRALIQGAAVPVPSRYEMLVFPAGKGRMTGGEWVLVYLAAYAAAASVFLALDVLWLNRVAQPLFQRNVGELLLENFRLGVAAGFYAAYLGGVLYFAVVPAAGAGELQLAVLNGGLLGFIAYGTYEATNMATMRGWTYRMVVLDVAWGTLLTAISAAAGYLAWLWIAG